MLRHLLRTVNLFDTAKRVLFLCFLAACGRTGGGGQAGGRGLVYYERGGIAHTWRVVLFHWTPQATKFECGGMAPGGLLTIDDVRKAVLSGAIKDPAGVW